MPKLSHKTKDRTVRFDELPYSTVFALAERKSTMEYMKIVQSLDRTQFENAVNLCTGKLVKIGYNDLCDPLGPGDSLIITGEDEA